LLVIIRINTLVCRHQQTSSKKGKTIIYLAADLFIKRPLQQRYERPNGEIAKSGMQIPLKRNLRQPPRSGQTNLCAVTEGFFRIHASP
jgi:hypothetical protein